MENKIVVGLPYVDGEEELIKKLTKLIYKRAGVPVTVVTQKDDKGIGWVAMQNKICRENTFDWYIYAIADYFPGRKFIKLALEKATTSKKRFVGFNDGKWFGKNATAGMIHKSLIPEMYGEPLFYPSYDHHGADPDLTEKAMLMKEYVYCPEAIFMEVDYNKDFRTTSYPVDMQLYYKRKSKGFPKWKE